MPGIGGPLRKANWRGIGGSPLKVMAGKTSPPDREELREPIAALRRSELQDISVNNKERWIESQIANGIKLFATIKCSHRLIVVFANRLPRQNSFHHRKCGERFTSRLGYSLAVQLA